MAEVKLETQFGDNSIPQLLVALEQFQRRQSVWYAGDFRLSDFDGEHGTVEVFGRLTPASRKLVTFGRDEGGGIYGFWLFDDRTVKQAPVVYVCPEDRYHRIIAKDLADFLRLLEADVPSVGAPGSFAQEPEAEEDEYSDEQDEDDDYDEDPEAFGSEQDTDDSSLEDPYAEDGDESQELDPRAVPEQEEDPWLGARYEPGPSAGHEAYVDWLRERNISAAQEPAKLSEDAGEGLPNFHHWFTEQNLALALADEFSRATDVPALGAEGPFLVEDEAAQWRSRVANGRWEVNVSHPDYDKVSDDPEAQIQYLVILRAEECVNANGEATVEQLVDVLVQLVGE